MAFEQLNSLLVAAPLVNGYHKARSGLVRQDALGDRAGEPKAIHEPIADEAQNLLRVGTQPAQARPRSGVPADAVDIVVGVDGDYLVAVEGSTQPIGGQIDGREIGGIVQAFERGFRELGEVDAIVRPARARTWLTTRGRPKRSASARTLAFSSR